MAKRQGLQLTKSRTRDPYAIDYGGYMLVGERNVAVYGAEPRAWCATLDDIEHWLTTPEKDGEL